MRESRAIAAIAAASVAILLILFIFLYIKKHVSLPAVNGSAPPAETSASFTWEGGGSSMYRFRIESEVTSFQSSSPAVQRIKSEGVLNFRIFGIEGGMVKAGFQLSPFRLTFSGKEDAGLSALHTAFFLASLDESGEIKELYFPGDIAVEDRDAVAENLRALQFIIPPGSKNEWGTRERHANGEYSARYMVMEDGNILKSKTSYASPGAGQMLKTDVTRSRVIADIDTSKSWIANLKGEETLELKNVDGTVLIKTDSHIELIYMPFLPDRGLDIWKEERSFEAIAASFNEMAAPKLSFHQKRRSDAAKSYFIDKGIKFEGILRDIRQNMSDRQKKEELIEFLKIFPDEALKFQDTFLTSGDRDFKNVAFNILKLAGTPQAQKVITDIILGEAYSETDRLHAIFTISGIEAPTPDTVNALWRRYEDRSGPAYFSDSSLLAVGALSGKLGSMESGSAEKALSDEINMRISRELNSAVSSDEKSAVLGAIGNTGNVSFLSDVSPYISYSDAKLRGDAANALRGMDIPEVHEILSNALKIEGNSNVRKQIMSSLLSMSESPKVISVLRERLGAEESAEVRHGMIEYLAKHLDNYPENKALLKNILPKETDKKNIRLIIQNTRD